MAQITLNNPGNSFTAGSLNPGDQIILRPDINYTYLYIGGINGNSASPITIVTQNNSQVNMSAGISIEDCSYLHVDAGNGGTYNIKITAQADSGVPVVVKGHSHNIELNGIEAINGIGGMWVKTELEDTHCDSTLLYPNRIDTITIHDCYIHGTHGDGLYLGSTDPFGGNRPLNCNGVTTYPRPQGLSNIVVYNIRVDSVNRTGIQLSGADQGVNKIYNCIISNCGLEYNNTQGAGIFVGGATTDCEVYGNTINNTWEHGIFSYGLGTTYIHDNVVNGSGLLGDRNIGYAMSNIFHNFLNTGNAILKIMNNTCGSNTDTTDDYKIAVYNNAGTGGSSQNIICNSGKVYVQTGVVYGTNCTGVIIPPPNPTVTSYSNNYTNATATLKFSDGTTKVISNVIKVCNNYKQKNYNVFLADGTKQTYIAS